MKKKMLLCAAVLVALLLGPRALAAPPCPDALTVKQPSGQTLQISQRGDERFHWAQTDDGYAVIQSDDGAWHYAALQDGRLRVLEALVGVDPRPRGTATEAAMQAALEQSRDEAMPFSVQRAPGKGAAAVDLATHGPQNALVLLVDFSDIKLQYASRWSARIFGHSNPAQPIGDNNSTVNGLYKEMSGGAFWFTAATENQGTADDGVIRVTLGVHPAFPSAADGRYSDPDAVFQSSSRQVAVQAFKAANAYINFARYDANGDGQLQPTELHIVLILAGYENSYNPVLLPGVWGHSDGLPLPQAPVLDGVAVGLSYTEQGERLDESHMMTIGVIAHELGHSLGLPDLYDTTGMTEGVGIHSLMSAGSWGFVGANHAGSSPTHMDAWCKMELGWGALTERSDGDIALNSSAGKAYNILKVPTANPNEYFLLENRQFTGYDAALRTYCRSGGVAIWHVDESVLDACETQYGGWYNVNNDTGHKAVDLEEADEGSLGYSQLDSGLYPLGPVYDGYYRSGFQTQFNGGTRPSSNLYGGGASGVQVSVLSAPGTTMKVSLGAAQLRIDSLSGPGASVLAGQTVRWVCKASGTPGITYAFDVLDATGKRVAGAGYAAGGGFEWRPMNAGTYRVRAWARGGGVAVSRLSGAFKVTGNRYVPVIKANGGRLADGKVSRYTVTVTAGDADKGDKLTLSCTRNGEAIGWPTKGAFGSDGSYIITAQDLAGHKTTFRFFIDRQKPIIAAVAGKTTLKNDALAAAPVKVTVADTTLSGRTVTRDGKALRWPSNNTFSADGVYTVSARDKLGNSATLRFTVDRTPPVISAKASGRTLAGGTATSAAVTVTVSDKRLGTRSVSRNGSALAWPSHGRFSAPGVYTVSAVDRAGNRRTFTFTIRKH